MKNLSLKFYTSNLLDRRALHTLRDVIFEAIKSSESGTILKLDLAEIEWINSSGVDEVIGSAIRRLHETSKEIYLFLETQQNLYEHTFNLQKALHDAKMPIMVSLKQNKAVEAHVIGPLNDYLNPILKLVYSSFNEGISSSEASAELGLGKSMSSSSLSKLYELRLLKRVRTNIGRGYEYKYYPLFQTRRG